MDLAKDSRGKIVGKAGLEKRPIEVSECKFLYNWKSIQLLVKITNNNKTQG